MKFPTFGNVDGPMELDPIFKLGLKVFEFENFVKIEIIGLIFKKIGLKPTPKEPTNFFLNVKTRIESSFKTEKLNNTSMDLHYFNNRHSFGVNIDTLRQAMMDHS
jgi:hypothetical protein